MFVPEGYLDGQGIRVGGSVPGSKYASKLSIDAAAAAGAGGVYWRVAAERVSPAAAASLRSGYKLAPRRGHLRDSRPDKIDRRAIAAIFLGSLL